MMDRFSQMDSDDLMALALLASCIILPMILLSVGIMLPGV